MDFKIGDKVKLPLNETGTVVEKLNIPWGFDHIVKIRKATFNKINQKIKYKKEQLAIEAST